MAAFKLSVTAKEFVPGVPWGGGAGVQPMRQMEGWGDAPPPAYNTQVRYGYSSLRSREPRLIAIRDLL